MNYKSCLFINSKYKPIIEGNCPDTPEDEGDDIPVDGKWSFNKQIFKDGVCQSIYVHLKNLKKIENTCKIYNPIMETQ